MSVIKKPKGAKDADEALLVRSQGLSTRLNTAVLLIYIHLHKAKRDSTSEKTKIPKQ